MKYPKTGMVGLCLAPELLQPLNSCTRLGCLLQQCSGWASLVLVGPLGGAGGQRADGCALPPGRASLHDKASLRIEQVRSEDQGWYECKVLMLDQQYDTFHNGSWVHLTVNGELGVVGTAAAGRAGGCGVAGGLHVVPVPRQVSL